MTSDFGYDPIPLTLESAAATVMQHDITRRIRLFLGHYDLRVYLTDKAYIDVGRGSFNAALRVEHINIGYEGCVGTVGQFCDFALPCKLFAGGEHRNELPINITMTGVPSFQAKVQSMEIENLRPHEPAPFEIGNAVLVSTDSKVMSGARIGDGAVLAANALASGLLDAFSIHGGLPARKIKARFDAATEAAVSSVRWWDFDIVYLGNNINRLQELAVDTAARHIYHKPAPRLVIKLAKMNTPNQQVEVVGFMDAGHSHPLSEAPIEMRKYLAQIGGAGPYYWLANAWG